MTQKKGGSQHETPDAGTAQAPIKPLVTVIVRTIGRATVHAALDSVAQQTYRPIEVVLVHARGRSEQAWPVSVHGVSLRVPDTQGQHLARAAAANFGLRHARGDLALFLDDDDELLPDHLTRLQQALAQAPEAPAAFSDTDFGYPEGSGWHSLHRFEGGFDAIRLRFENYLPIHSVLFRLDDATPSVDEAFDLFEDWDFWLQMCQRGDLVHVPGVTARYVAAEGQRSGVFVDSPATRSARAQLYTKWQTASSAQDHALMVARLQQLYRAHAHDHANLLAGKDAQVHQNQLIAARESEVAAARDQLGALQSVLVARERELAAFAEHARDLTELVSIREAECASATQHAQSLSVIVAARDDSLADAARHAQALTSLVAIRETELAEATRHAQALSDVVAARDGALAEGSRYVSSLTLLVTQREHEWAQAAAYAAELKRHLEARCAELELAADERVRLIQMIGDKDQALAALRSERIALNSELETLLAQPPLRALVESIKRRRDRRVAQGT